MKKLVDGIHRFQAGAFGSKQALFARLANGQEPDALFVTCSDSRVSPSLLTQTQPGDLFVLRNVGNIVPPYGPVCGAEAAAIEYAVGVLGLKDIIICGHTHCGAMKVVLDPALLEGFPAMSGWLVHADPTRRVMAAHYRDVPEDEALDACIEENVLVQVEHLRTHPAVLAALSRGTLRLHAWVYDIGNGRVAAFDEHAGQYVPIAEASLGMTGRSNRRVAARDV